MSSRKGISVIKLREMMMILDLHRQGLSVSAIAKADWYRSQDGAQVHRARSGGSDLWDRVSGSGVADSVGRRALRQEAGLISGPRLAG
ncbi:IS21 family insertion sequence transposase domain-containing protein (plasmid) [Sinorhizobium fredii]|uniref:IS21 family insertion sequence transposase domain-containing protein n=1 Tax=Rhizobium fredii TaxID=380 RepID=A0A2L0HBS8_RHIFR|nr:IS21 family insertion sequence transposase domain-containing protein [Sinorhizobium fredii]